jgi:hypothetical protein
MLTKTCLNETCSEVHVVKHLFHYFPIQNGLKQEFFITTANKSFSSPQPFNYALEYTINKVRKNQVELKLNGKLQLLFCDCDINLVGDNMYVP